MIQAQEFWKKNEGRIESVRRLLADDFSRAVYDAVWDYRRYRIPVKKELYDEKNQYKIEGICVPENNEVFIDGGGYVGDTIDDLLDYAKREHIKINKIISFEPDGKNYIYIQKKQKKHGEITLVKKGLSKREGNLFFDEKGVCARIVEKREDATTTIPVINIDSVKECAEASYIKMDIEGAELDALKGAEDTIIRKHPKLAICIYHKDEDMVGIIEYIHEIAPEYKFYIRHHSRCQNETVCYAVAGRGQFSNTL